MKTPWVTASFMAMALETLAIVNVTAAEKNIGNVIQFFATHSLACLLFAFAFHKALPLRYRNPLLAVILFVLLTTFFMPGVGMVGLGIFIIPALYRQRVATTRSNRFYKSADKNKFDFSVKDPGSRIRTPGYLDGALSYSSHSTKRMEALVAAARLADRDVDRFLRYALRDKEDDVRLLAYCLISEREKALEAVFSSVRSHSETTAPELTYQGHRVQAHHFWKLAQLQLAPPSLQKDLYHHARMHTEAALQFNQKDASLFFLLGQIALQEQETNAAEISFRRALDCGMDKREVYPLLAEIEFHRGRFSAIRGYLASAGNGSRRLTIVRSMAYWQGQGT